MPRFARINADCNTIVRTGVIAELAITFLDNFKELLPGDEDNEKISQFAKRCRRAITKEMAERITTKKRMFKYT